MQNKEKTQQKIDERKAIIEETAFQLFAKNSIEKVSMQKIADEAKVGVATLFRHYPTKLDLAAASCGKKWDEYFNEMLSKRSPEFLKNVDAIDRLDFTFDIYIDLYKNHKDLLVFNEDFNHFREKTIDTEECENQENHEYYENAMDGLSRRFQNMYQRAKEDKSMRTDYPEEELRRILLHTMMGACIHYLSGFSWGANENEDYSQELITLKDILMNFAQKGNTKKQQH